MRNALLRFAFAFTPIFAALSGAAQAQSADVAEFYNTNLNHYFITPDAKEAAIIESGGAGLGWVRAVGSFTVPRSLATSPTAKRVCRFYAAGPNSHFFTADEAECANLLALEAKQRAAAPSGQAFMGWGFEGISFYAQVPDANTGACAAGTTPVFRFYNNRAAAGDSNHRFVVEGHARAEMMNKGWIDEGVAFCAESAALPVETAAGSVDCGSTYPSTNALRFEGTNDNLSRNLSTTVAFTLNKRKSVVFNNQTAFASEVTDPAGQVLETFYTAALFEQSIGKSQAVRGDFSDTEYDGPSTPYPRRWPLGVEITRRSESRGRFVDEVKPSNSGTYTQSAVTTKALLGVTPVTSPAGTFSNACKFRIVTSIRSGDGGEELDAEEMLWQVPGVGAVRKEISMTYYIPGAKAEQLRIFRELVEIK